MLLLLNALNDQKFQSCFPGAFAKLGNGYFASSCLSTWNTLATTGWIFIKIDTSFLHLLKTSVVKIVED